MAEKAQDEVRAFVLRILQFGKTTAKAVCYACQTTATYFIHDEKQRKESRSMYSDLSHWKIIELLNEPHDSFQFCVHDRISTYTMGD